MRSITRVLAALVLMVAVSPSLALDRLEQIRRAVERRFGPILAADGVDVRSGSRGAVQVRLAVAPAHASDGRPRRWTANESRKILLRLRDVFDQECPGTEILSSSGIELEEPGRSRRRIEDLRGLVQPRALTRPDEARADGRWAADGAPSPAPSAIPGTPVDPDASPTGSPPAALPPPGLPAQASSDLPSPAAQTPAPPPAGPEFSNPPEPPQTAPPPVPPGEAPARPRSAFPAQPGGFGNSTWTSRGPTVPVSMYQYPRDNEALEFIIEREVADTLRSTFKDARVRARIVRPQVVKLTLEVAMNGHPGENLPNILHFSRDTTRNVFRERFNLLRIHHQSRIRVTEADDRFSYDYRFNELTPYGQQDRGEDDPLFRAIRAERAWMVDLPRAYTLGRNTSAFSIGATNRRLSPGSYSNVSSSRATAGYFTLRHGFFERLETSLSYYTYSNTVVPTVRNVFADSTGSLSVAAFGLKYLMPYELNGLTLAVGLTQGFQPGDERRYYMPDDFERLYNLYVVGSRRIFENILLHLAVKRTAITQKPDYADNAINSVGMGFEYLLADRAILMLELKHDRYSSSTLTNFGTITDGDGLNVNAGVVVGTTLGDVEVSARKISVPTQKEFCAGISYRW